MSDANANDYQPLDTSNHRYRTIVLAGAPRWDDIKGEPLLPADEPIQPFRYDPEQPKAIWRVVKTGEALAPLLTPRVPALDQDSVNHSLSLYDTDTDTDSEDEGELDKEDEEESTEVDTSFFTVTSFTSGVDESIIHDLPPLVDMTDLEDLPHARVVAASPKHAHIITALVGVIAISEPRTVITRHGYPMKLVSLTVGDETMTGFRIDVWLASKPRTVAARELNATIETLRLQDIIVVKNISLGVYQNKVFGATMPKAVSKIWLVKRFHCFNREEEKRFGIGRLGNSIQAKKIRKVVDWVREFVDTGRRPGPDAGEEEEELPDDTQANNSYAIIMPG